MANHTYYLLPVTYYQSPCSLLFSSQRGQGDKGTGGQGDKYILSPPPLENGVYIYPSTFLQYKVI